MELYVRGGSGIGDTPDLAVNVFGYVQRSVGSYRQPGRSGERPARLLVGARKSVRKHNVVPCGAAVGERLKDDGVAGLSGWCAIPRAMKRDEGTSPIRVWKLLRLVDHQVVRSPVRREEECGSALLGAHADLAATIAAVLRCEYQLLL